MELSDTGVLILKIHASIAANAFCRLHNDKYINFQPCITKYSGVMIFAANEPPQYIVVPHPGGETADMVRISQ